MIKKFAVLAVIAGVFAACGGGMTPEQIEAKAQATKDSLAKVLQEQEAKAQAIQDSITNAAKAVTDSATSAVEGAVDGAVDAVKEAAK